MAGRDVEEAAAVGGAGRGDEDRHGAGLGRTALQPRGGQRRLEGTPPVRADLLADIYPLPPPTRPRNHTTRLIVGNQMFWQQSICTQYYMQFTDDSNVQ